MLKNLKALRMEYGISQQKLAEAIYVTQPSINKYENHDIEPEIEILKRMAEYFNTTIDYIVGYSDQRYPVTHWFDQKLNPTENDLLTLYRTLSPDEQSCVRETVRLFAEKPRERMSTGD